MIPLIRLPATERVAIRFDYGEEVVQWAQLALEAFYQISLCFTYELQHKYFSFSIPLERSNEEFIYKHLINAFYPDRQLVGRWFPKLLIHQEKISGIQLHLIRPQSLKEYADYIPLTNRECIWSEMEDLLITFCDVAPPSEDQKKIEQLMEMVRSVVLIREIGETVASSKKRRTERGVQPAPIRLFSQYLAEIGWVAPQKEKSEEEFFSYLISNKSSPENHFLTIGFFSEILKCYVLEMKNLENKARRNIQINDRLSRLKLSGQWTISILKKRDLKVQRVFFEIIKQLKSLSFLNFGDCDFLANRDDLLNCISTFISDRPFALTVYLNWNLNKGKKLSLSAADEMIQFFNQSASQPQYQQDEYENDIQTLGDVLMSYVSNVNFVIQSFALAEAFQDVGNTIAETQRTSLLSEYMRRYRFDLLRLGLTVD